jgi:hypothetical protein
MSEPDVYPDSMIEAGLDAYENKDRGSPRDTERYLAHAYLAFPKALRALRAERNKIADLEDIIEHMCNPQGEMSTSMVKLMDDSIKRAQSR